jgi:hypothetical protein
MTPSHPSPFIQRLVADLDAPIRRQEQRAATRRRRVRRTLTAVAGAALATTAGAGATGSLGVFESTSSYDITEHRGTPNGRICLDLRVAAANRRSLYGCGQAPTAATPFGMLVVDREADAERIVYGLVTDQIVTVRMGGRDAVTEARPGLPGRFFSFKVPDEGTVYAEGIGASGDVVATIGSKVRARTPPQSAAQARAQGDLAGFAPAAGPAPFVHAGRVISGEEAQSQHLICSEDESPTIRCVAP